jgi:hypothetical protein
MDMELFTQTQLEILERNSEDDAAWDLVPVAKFIHRKSGYCWLVTRYLSECGYMMHGLGDYSNGYPMLCTITWDELSSHNGILGEPAVQDPHFEGLFPISVYADAAQVYRRIVEDGTILSKFAAPKLIY